MATMLMLRLGRNTAEMRSAERMAGKSLHRVHEPHESLVEPAAEVARQHMPEARAPMPMPIPTAITPTRMEVTAPVITRERRSRPN